MRIVCQEARRAIDAHARPSTQPRPSNRHRGRGLGLRRAGAPQPLERPGRAAALLQREETHHVDERVDPARLEVELVLVLAAFLHDERAEEAEQYGEHGTEDGDRRAQKCAERDTQADDDDHLQPNGNVSLRKIPRKGRVGRFNVQVRLGHAEVLHGVIAADDHLQLAVVHQVVKQIDLALR